MANRLDDIKIAILATDGFEQSELLKPQQKLKDEGATVHVIAPKSGQIKGWDKKDWGESVDVDVELSDANPDDYDALVMPGGVMNPDTLRINDDAVSFTKKFMESGKVVASICHGPWTLIETGYLKGKQVTSYPTLRTDLINAGADWTDKEVVTDNGLITSRNPDDIPAFCDKIIEEILEGRHDRGDTKRTEDQPRA